MFIIFVTNRFSNQLKNQHLKTILLIYFQVWAICSSEIPLRIKFVSPTLTLNIFTVTGTGKPVGTASLK